MAEEFEATRQQAEDGDANAQFNLGYAYCDGIEGVVERDATEAVVWFSQAANQGHADAQCMLGSCYDFGQGIDQDFSKAIYWYSQSARQGHALAQWRLGIAYQEERGVVRNLDLAMEWTQKAALQGVESADETLVKLQELQQLEAQQALEAAENPQEEEKEEENDGAKDVEAGKPVSSDRLMDEDSTSPQKKPWYCQVWFLALLALLLLGALIGGIVGGVLANKDDGDNKNKGDTLPEGPTRAPSPPTPPPTEMPTGSPWTQVGGNDAIVGLGSGFRVGTKVATSGDGTVVAAGSPDANFVLVSRYDATTGNWTAMGQPLTPLPPVISQQQRFGISLSLNKDGTILAVGAEWAYQLFVNNQPNILKEAGKVTVFRYDGTQWISMGEPFQGPSLANFTFNGFLYENLNFLATFGRSVSLNDAGDRLAVGIPYSASLGEGNPLAQFEVGLAQVYGFDGTAWQKYGFPMGGKSRHSWFGYSVSLSGDGLTVAVGAPNFDRTLAPGYNDTYLVGEVSVYSINLANGVWQLTASFLAERESPNFGYSVSISKDGTIVAGSSYNADNLKNNHVRVFEKQVVDGNTTWVQLGQTIEYDNVGLVSKGFTDVDLSDDGRALIFGAPEANQARVFELSSDNSTWVQVGGAIQGDNPFDSFGISVALADHTETERWAVVGAPHNPLGSTLVGHARVFASP